MSFFNSIKEAFSQGYNEAMEKEIKKKELENEKKKENDLKIQQLKLELLKLSNHELGELSVKSEDCKNRKKHVDYVEEMALILAIEDRGDYYIQEGEKLNDKDLVSAYMDCTSMLEEISYEKVIKIRLKPTLVERVINEKQEIEARRYHTKTLIR